MPAHKPHGHAHGHPAHGHSQGHNGHNGHHGGHHGVHHGGNHGGHHVGGHHAGHHAGHHVGGHHAEHQGGHHAGHHGHELAQHPVSAPPPHPGISKADQQHYGGQQYHEEAENDCCGCGGQDEKGGKESCYGENEQDCCYCMADSLFRLFCFSFFGVCIRLPCHPRQNKAPGPDMADTCDLVSYCCNGGMCT